MTSEFITLIERLETVKEGSRELDAAIVAILNDCIVRPYPPTDDFGPRNKWQFWSSDGKHFLGSESKFPVQPFTTSIDAVAVLMKKSLLGADLELFHGFDESIYVTLTMPRKTEPYFFNVFSSCAATEPLARCAVLLRALAERGMKDDKI